MRHMCQTISMVIHYSCAPNIKNLGHYIDNYNYANYNNYYYLFEE